jgi:VWFA-related protein
VPGVERVEVRLAQYDVVVRDKAGRIVSGLLPGDFSVQEDGVPLEIVAVDEWGVETPALTSSPASAQDAPPAPAPASPPPAAAATDKDADRRSFILVFDALGDSTALRMNQAKTAAQKFVRKHVTPNDLVAVYQMDLSLRAVSGFSRNAEATASAIEKIAWMPASSLQDDINESVLAYSSTGNNPLAQQRLTEMSQLVTSQLEWRRNHAYEQLDQLSEVFGALPGRRILVLASPGFPMTTTGDMKIQTGGFNLTFQKLIRDLSRLGVTVYTLDIGNDLAMGDAGEKIDWRIAVGKMGMDENVLTDLGLERSMGTGGAGARREFLGVLAAETGGRLLTSTDLSRDFETIHEESARFYRIACRVNVTSKESRYRRTVIRVDRPGLSVTSRRGRYSDVSPANVVASSSNAVAETLDNYRPISTRGTALTLPSSDGKRIPVAVVVEALGPIDIPVAPNGAGSIDIEFHLVARAADEVVDRYERRFTAKVRAEGVEALRQALRAEGRLSLVPGVYEVQASLRLLDPPQLARWSSTVAVPPQSSGSALAISEAFLTTAREDAAPLVTRPEIPDLADALLLQPGVRVLPATTSDFEAGRPIDVVFWLRGVPLVEGKPKLNLSVHVLDGEGKAVEVPTQLALFAPEPSGGYRAVARAQTEKLPAGAYTVRLEARPEDAAATIARRTVPFSLHAGARATSSSAP